MYRKFKIILFTRPLSLQMWIPFYLRWDKNLSCLLKTKNVALTKIIFALSLTLTKMFSFCQHTGNKGLM